MVNIHCFTPKSLIWNVTHKRFDRVFVSQKDDNAEKYFFCKKSVMHSVAKAFIIVLSHNIQDYIALQNKSH